MDVFRTGRRGRVVPLTEENYRRETNRKAPFVQMRGGHPSYFAVCPACGNRTRNHKPLQGHRFQRINST